MASRLTTTGLHPRPALRLLAVATVIAGAAALTGLASSAAAAPADQNSSDAKYYVSQVTAIQPPTPGLEVVVHGAGESVTLTNRTGKTVTVVGYSGEDYLRITGSKVDQNTNSMTAALNKTQGRGPLPEKFSDNAKNLPVEWQQVSDTNTFSWPDFRTRWGVDQRPPIVQQHPHSRHLVFEWAIQLKVGTQPALVRGTVAWIGAPGSDGPGSVQIAVGGLLIVLALLALVVVLRLRRRRRLARSLTIAGSQPDPGTDDQTSRPADDRADDSAVNSTAAKY